MTIGSELLHRHIQTLVEDNMQWQMLVADDVLWERLRTVHRASSTAVWAGGSCPSRNLVRRGCGELPLLRTQGV